MSGEVRTVYVSTDRLVPLAQRRFVGKTILHGGAKYERSTEDGIEHQRLLSSDGTLAGPWRRLDGELA